MIEARGLSKSSGGVSVLRDVTFALPGGSRTALPGANGSGKTTLPSTLGSRVRSRAVLLPLLSLALLVPLLIPTVRATGGALAER